MQHLCAREPSEGSSEWDEKFEHGMILGGKIAPSYVGRDDELGDASTSAAASSAIRMSPVNILSMTNHSYSTSASSGVSAPGKVARKTAAYATQALLEHLTWFGLSKIKRYG